MEEVDEAETAGFFQILLLRCRSCCGAQGREFRSGTPEFGEAFETLIFQELIAYRDYVSGESIRHWRAKSGFEVDFIIGDHTGIEIKAGKNVSNQDLKSLRALAEEHALKRYLCVCQEERPRKVGKISVIPYKQFLDSLWSGEYKD